MDGGCHLNRRFSLDSSGYTPDGGGLLGKAKSNKMRRSSEGTKVHSLDGEQLHLTELNRSIQRTNPTRTAIEEEGTDSVEGLIKSSSFTNHKKTFHKHFPEISDVENLSHVFTCALQKEVLYHGKMYVSQHHVCFHSSVLLKETKVVIHASTVQAIKKKNTARVVPSAISILTHNGHKYVFVSLRNRDTCFSLLRSICPQLQDLGPNGSPQMSSAENGHELEVDTVSSHSSHEDSMDQKGVSLPEENNSTLPLSSSDIPQAHASSGSTPQDSTSREGDSSEQEGPDGWVTVIAEKIKSLLSISGSTNIKQLLIVYLILVILLLLSSGYIGLRIIALEEQLNSLGGMPDELNLQGECKET